MKRFALLSLLLLPVQGFAIPVQWTLDGYITTRALEDGRATGSFIYDADTGIFSDIALATTGTPSGGLLFDTFAGAVSVFPDGMSGLNFVQAGYSGTGETVGFHLAAIFVSQLTNVGGVLTVNPDTQVASFAEFSCSDLIGCGQNMGGAVSNWYAWNPVQSTLTGIPMTAVDEPGALAMFAGAIALVLYARRRRAAVRGG